MQAAGQHILDMDSSESPTHGEQEGSVWNGHFGCTCYHPLFSQKSQKLVPRGATNVDVSRDPAHCRGGRCAVGADRLRLSRWRTISPLITADQPVVTVRGRPFLLKARGSPFGMASVGSGIACDYSALIIWAKLRY
jgi:Transposase DDE domain group 1